MMSKQPAGHRGTPPARRLPVRTPRSRAPHFPPPIPRSPIDPNIAIEEEMYVLRAEAELLRARYRHLFDLDPDAHFVTDRIGVITEANRAASSLFGVPGPFLVGKPLAVYVMLEDRGALRSGISAMLHTDRREMTLRLIPRGPAARIVNARVLAVRESLDEPFPGIRWMIRDMSDARATQEEISASREKLREMTSELSLAEERVRRDIAVGIHDRVSQPLAMIKILLAKAKLTVGPNQKPEIAEMLTLLQQAIDESRTLTFELSPPILYELGLEAAVEWLGEQMQRRYRLKIRCNARELAREIPLDSRILIFQAIRELLTNVVKHAKARSVAVQLQSRKGNVQVIVSDDGAGFFTENTSALQSKSDGFGLFSNRTRVERVGGVYQLRSHPGRGTRVTLTVPIPPTPAAEEAVPDSPAK